MMQPAQSSIIICSIVRDAEVGLRRNIPIINELCKCFKAYRIYVFENDSKDATKKLLKDWSEMDPVNIHVSINQTDSSKTIPSQKSAGTVNPFYSRKRIEKMANIRNHYMQYIDDAGWEADYLMVVDLDVAQLFLSPILSSFDTKLEWDAVCANGYSVSPSFKRRYHDSYALVEHSDEQPQTEKKIKLLSEKYGSLNKGDSWIPISSGFGGLAIYRFDAIKGLRYQCLPNDDKRVEVKCEHTSIYQQLHKRGFSKFYLNPGMYLKYQDVTFFLVWNTLVRKFNSVIHR